LHLEFAALRDGLEVGQCYDVYMNNRQKADELLAKLEFLFERYSNELRKTTQPYQLQRVIKSIPDYTYHPDDILVREPLMEHIGSLPMVATAMYPYINDPEVDLGKTLTMLAIHDIGELITGDEMTFTKDKSKKDPEAEAALSLLDPHYHSFYHDVENQSSPSAKFAKAVDKITPDIFDYLTPVDITIRRFKHFVGTDTDKIIDLYLTYKRPYMQWNPFMNEFHTLLIDKLVANIKEYAQKPEFAGAKSSI